MKAKPQTSKEFLEAYDPGKYPSVALTSDLVVFAVSAGLLNVALVRRGEHPFKGSLALPGGFVGPEESAEEAARRELAEETGLDLGTLPVHVEQLATYTSPGRDPRMRVVSVAHLALLATGGTVLPRISAGSDAAAATWQPVHDVIAGGDLAFDHEVILQDGLARLSGKMEYTTVAARLLPHEFTLTQLRSVYDAVWDTTLPAGNFTRKMMPHLNPTGHKARAAAGGAPAALFTSTGRHIHPPLTNPRMSN
ncbi:NUDIX domain-containing protein [Paenarthrobacter ilicis]|uniref:8-oxo-dGTP diphosphatase n=1 Tax=Paenarthrobacter ilicis TaxID=43665 RepID=A0ABX0TEM7_9MICC|nr:NUDIX hydrolase [Paenarthrobacter ilicis]MBM7792205.1 8-oxo-dGTP diphosphatase [Paenarthrobacter ilicis]NIJ00549.1 8-oxo-dGTP diphosphatase [Paenarthrobacter ilicis]